MAFSTYRANFKGSLSNIKSEELRVLDFNKSKFKERLAFIQEKHEKVKPFYDSYIFTKDKDKNSSISSQSEEYEEYYKVNLNCTDVLSEEINIFKCLERDGSYLINSVDIPREIQQKYRILSEQEFKNILSKEKNNISYSQEDVMDILERPNENKYLSRDLKINKSDFTNPTIGEILSSYQQLVNILKVDMDKLKNKEEAKFDLGFIKRNLATLKGDMLDTKKILLGIRNPAKRLGDESGMFYSDSIDYTNPNHIKAIIRNIRLGAGIDPDSELSHIAYDIEVALRALYKINKLDKLDLEVVECVNAGYSEREIAVELNKGKTTIQQRISKICNRISKYYSKKE